MISDVTIPTIHIYTHFYTYIYIQETNNLNLRIFHYDKKKNFGASF